MDGHHVRPETARYTSIGFPLRSPGATSTSMTAAFGRFVDWDQARPVEVAALGMPD